MKNLCKRFSGGGNFEPVTSFTKGTLLSLMLVAFAAMTACTDDTESIGNHNSTPLSINVGVDTPQSRALIAGNSLPDGSQIGVSVVDASGTNYQDQDYNNVCYQAVTEDGTQKWKVQSRSDILLSGEAGTLYAYYPWTAAVTDFTQIAVNMDEAEQKDWMVAEPITNLSDAQATAAVKMKHMLTNFKLSFYKDNYSGKGEVTAVTIRSNAFATTGTLDATTGTFAAYGDGHTLTRTFATTLGTDKTAATACNVMVVPNTVAAPVTISVTVDGNTYSSVTSSLTLEKAKSYNYAMKLSSTGLNITEVTLTDWQTTDLGDTEFKPEQGTSQDTYGDWVQATYTVTDNSTSTQIFYRYFDIAKVEEMLILENAGSRAVAEPVVVTPANTYQFTTTGTHTVYIKFADMTMIPQSVFKSCTQLFSVVVPESVTKVEYSVFSYCSKLHKIEFKSLSAPILGNDVFWLVNKGCNLYVSEGAIGYEEWCTSDNYLIYLEKGSYVEENSFYYSLDGKKLLGNNKKVTGKVSIKEGVEEIGPYAVSRMYDITGVDFPATVLDIKIGAFEGCTGLTEITIPNSVTNIGDDVFNGCNGLTEITIGSGVKTMGRYAVGNCKNLRVLKSLATTGAALTTDTFAGMEHTGIFIVPAGASYSEWLRTSTNNLGLERWKKVEEGNYIIEKGVYYSADGKTLLGVPHWMEGELIIKSGVTKIGKWAMAKCTNITSIVIPETVTEVSEGAFEYCTGVTEIVLPNSVQTLQQTAFRYCSDLKEITLGTGMKDIKSQVFSSCTELETIKSLAITAPNIDSQSCRDIKEWGIIVIPENSFDSYYSKWMKTTSYYPGKYGWKCVEDCYQLEDGLYYSEDGKTVFVCAKDKTGDVIIKNGVEEIAGMAFYGCSGIKSVSMPNTIKSIGLKEFEGCTTLERITSLAMTAPTIGKNTFYSIKSGGILYVPQSATGYDTWIQTGNTNNYEFYLGNYNWTKQDITEN